MGEDASESVDLAARIVVDDADLFRAFDAEVRNAENGKPPKRRR